MAPPKRPVPLSPVDRWLPWAPWVLVPLVAVACYANALGAPFVVDDLGVLSGATARGDVLDLLRQAFRPGADPIFRNRIVAYLSFALGTAVHGVHPAPLRAVNVALHAANALLVAHLAALALRGPSPAPERARRARAAALAAGLLFAAHPLATSAVTYVAQRLAVLATTFYLGALALHAAARARRSLGAAVALEAAAVVAGLLALRTKEIAFTLPLAAALFDVLFLARPARGPRWAWLAPVAALLPVLPLSMLRGGEASLRAATEMLPSARVPVTRWGYLVTEQTVLVRYLRLAVAPFGQRFFWPVPLRTELDLRSALAAALHLALLGGAAAVAWRARAPGREAPRLAAFGVLFFYVAASVESSVVPIQDLMFEHRAYLPLVGLALTAAGAGVAAADRLGDGRPLAMATAAAVVALGVGTVVRHHAWRSYSALMADGVEKSPESARLRLWYGMALKSEGDLRGAARAWREALARDACHVPSLNALGSLHYAANDPAGALALFDRANACDPGEPIAWMNGGAALDRLGRRAEARARFERFLALAPAGTTGAPAEPVRARLAQRD
jgi:Tfp pilus assembly protein PilF